MEPYDPAHQAGWKDGTYEIKLAKSDLFAYAAIERTNSSNENGFCLRIISKVP